MSLKTKIFPLYSTALAFAITCIFFCNWLILRDIFLKDSENNLQNFINYAISLIETEIEQEQIESAVQKLTKFEKFANCRITLIAADGKVIYDNVPNKKKLLNHTDRPEVLNALKSGFGKSYRFSSTLQTNSLYLAKSLKTVGGSVYILRVALTEKQIFERMNKILIRNAFFSLLAYAIGSLLIFFISLKINNPLKVIISHVANFAKGKFYGSIHPCGIYEIDRLSEEIEKMATELKDNIERTKRSHTELNAVLSSMREAVIAVDGEGRLILANKSAIKMFSLNEKNLIERRFVHEVLRNSQIQKFIQDLLDSKIELEDEFSFFSPKQTFIQARGTPLLSESGKAVGAVIVFNDVSKIKRLEDMRKDFVSNVSHEIRTPLTAIVGAVETLLDNNLKSKERQKILQILAKHAQRLNSLVDDILTLSRIEQGVEELEFRNYNIPEIIECSIETCREKAEEKKISFTTNLENIEWKVDSGLLQQALVNLIDNAIKYSDEKSNVYIECKTDGNYLYISVEDEGCGIAPEHIPRIFERFYRVDKARSRELGGTGLGLAIVKYIVNAHKGEVTVKSEVGKGSVFTIKIPKT